MSKKIEAVPREVIDNQLLVTLDDKSKVAIVADEEDLKTMSFALRECLRDDTLTAKCHLKVTSLLEGIELLRDAAFGKEKP